MVDPSSAPSNICTANCVITGGTRPGGGGNLFHGFGQFNIGPADIATFQNGISFDGSGNALAAGLPTSSILARVTGTSGNNPTLSSIYGTIQTSGFGNANLFLMNPAGFLFGPNATVNVGGMVAFTSADYLRLEGPGANGIFYADTARVDVLTSAPVAAYGFLGSNPEAITVQGSQLTVTPGQSLSLVGGDITIQSSTLSTLNGQINLASVASPGEILTGALVRAQNINGQSFGNSGAIQITEQSVIDVSGNGGGTVLIRGGQFLLDNATIVAQVTGPGPVTNGVEAIGEGVDIQASKDAAIRNFAVIDTSVTGNATPDVTYGGAHVNAASVEVVDAEILSNVSSGSTGGNTGNITLEGNSLLVQDSGTFFQLLQADTHGAGNSGTITLTSQGDLHINNAFITTNAFSSATAGNINLTSMQGDISMVDTSHTAGPFITSQAVPPSVVGEEGNIATGRVGNITVSAPEGDVLLTDQGTVFTHIQGTGNNAGRGGVQVTANDLTMLGGSILFGIDNFTAFQSGNLTLNLTGRLTMTNLTNPDFPALLSTTTRGAAEAAALNITAHDIVLSGNARLSSQTVVTANPGSGTGNGGPINISTQTLELSKGAQITSGTVRGDQGNPSGNGGTVTIHGLSGPADSVLIDNADSGFFTFIQSPGVGSGIFTDTQGTGAGGNINVLATTLTLQNGGKLSAATSGTTPSGTGGTITVNAEQVAINSQAIITADTNGIAPAGVVDINTGTLAINSGGQIRSSSGAETQQLSTLALPLAPAQPLTGGTITIQGRTGTGSQADTVTIDGGGSGVFTESTGTRPGGDINILTSQSVAMTNGASISSSSTGTGNAGNININAGNQFIMTNSTVTTEANRASGGAIKITTTPAGTVQMTNSTISASVLDGTGGGGSVDIDPQFVILQNSQITADAESGPGGNIFITTNLLLQDPTSRISASSQFGQQGTVTIQSPASPASGKLVPLGQKPLIATALLSQRCAALAGGNASSFTVAGRDSLPAEPGGWVSSPLALSMAEANEGTPTETALSRLGEMAEETPLLSLRKVAPAGFLTQSFGAASSDCQS
jgi:filamentous hemagglutinin family protein